MFWYLRESAYYHKELNAQQLTSLYSESIENYIKICRDKKLYTESEIQSLENNLYSIIIIRHALAHNGFPNLLPVQLENTKRHKKPVTKTNNKSKKCFSTQEIEDAVKFYSNPSDFENINKKIIETIGLILKQLPQFSVGL